MHALMIHVLQNIKKNIKKYHHQFDAQDRLGREKASQVTIIMCTNMKVSINAGLFYYRKLLVREES